MSFAEEQETIQSQMKLLLQQHLYFDRFFFFQQIPTTTLAKVECVYSQILIIQHTLQNINHMRDMNCWATSFSSFFFFLFANLCHGYAILFPGMILDPCVSAVAPGELKLRVVQTKFRLCGLCNIRSSGEDDLATYTPVGKYLIIALYVLRSASGGAHEHSAYYKACQNLFSTDLTLHMSHTIIVT